MQDLDTGYPVSLNDHCGLNILFSIHTTIPIAAGGLLCDRVQKYIWLGDQTALVAFANTDRHLTALATASQRLQIDIVNPHSVHEFITVLACNGAQTLGESAGVKEHIFAGVAIQQIHFVNQDRRSVWKFLRCHPRWHQHMAVCRAKHMHRSWSLQQRCLVDPGRTGGQHRRNVGPLFQPQAEPPQQHWALCPSLIKPIKHSHNLLCRQYGVAVLAKCGFAPFIKQLFRITSLVRRELCQIRKRNTYRYDSIRMRALVTGEKHSRSPRVLDKGLTALTDSHVVLTSGPAALTDGHIVLASRPIALSDGLIFFHRGSTRTNLRVGVYLGQWRTCLI
mmetsp:Transcript_90258/g.206405  ORF Transcript_90258/g.206405 Transcript_90258/m.206405 type:complete len:335 (-) Transcript_90258:81-1085(-)